MNKLFLFVFFFSTLCASHHKQPFITSNEVLRFCQRSIFEVTDERIHLREDRIGFFKDRFFILNDFDDWVPLKELIRDQHGFFILMENPLCAFGHPGIRRVKFTWFCFDKSCPFFFHEHFKEGCWNDSSLFFGR
jgi:hypothetical protein